MHFNTTRMFFVLPCVIFIVEFIAISEQLRRTDAILQQYRAQVELRDPENYGFATIASIPLAHAAARELKGMHPKGLTFQLAPNPTDIVGSPLMLKLTCSSALANVSKIDLEKHGVIERTAKIQKNNWLPPLIYVLFS